MDRLKFNTFPPQLHSYEGGMFLKQQINVSKKSGSCFSCGKRKQVYLSWNTLFFFFQVDNIYQCSRSWVNSSLTAKIEHNVYVALYCDSFWHATCNIFEFLYVSMSYVKISTYYMILAFWMSVLTRFKKVNGSKNHIFAPTLKIWQP